MVRRVRIPVAGFAAAPRGTVLLVSDNAGFRAAAGRVLGRHGYQVLQATHAGHALLACLRHAGAIDLVVLDAVMADGCGRDAARRLMRARPDMQAIFLGEAGAAEAVHTIARPFTADDLLAGVDRALSAS
jgi:DNA-binding NtrC family response regulator